MQKGIVINLLDKEIRDVGTRDEPATPVAWIDGPDICANHGIPGRSACVAVRPHCQMFHPELPKGHRTVRWEIYQHVTGSLAA